MNSIVGRTYPCADLGSDLTAFAYRAAMNASASDASRGDADDRSKIAVLS